MGGIMGIYLQTSFSLCSVGLKTSVSNTQAQFAKPDRA